MKERSKRRPWGIIIFVLIVAFLIVFLSIVEFNPELPLIESIEEISFNLIGLAFALVGGLILVNQRRHLIGWLLIVEPLSSVFFGVLDQIFLPGILDVPTLNTAEFLYVWFSGWSWWLLIGPIFLIFLLFPTGRLISPKWRRAVFLLFGTFIYFVIAATSLDPFEIELAGGVYSWPNPIGFLSLEAAEPFFLVFSILLIVTTIVSTSSIFVRYRRADSLEKAQLRWLFYAVCLFLVVYILTFFVNTDGSNSSEVVNILFGLSLLFIPIAIGIAILRYRLWDIDFVINRSLIFGVVTTILAGVFAFTTTLTAQIAENIFGEEMNQAAAAVAVIVVASVFNPVRTRVEKAINRRLFPENVDLSEGLVELNPDLWHWIDLPTIMAATLKHLQLIYHYDVGAIYLLEDDSYVPAAARGVQIDYLPPYLLNAQDQKLFDEKKGVLHEKETPFVLSIPVYLKRRKSAQLTGMLRLGIRPKKRSYSTNDIKTLASFGGKLGEPFYALGRNHS